MNTKLLIFVLLFLFGCARLPVTDRNEAMRPSSKSIDFADDLEFSGLIAGIKANINFIKDSSRVPPEITFGKTKVPKKKYIAALQALADNSSDLPTFVKNIRENFDLYEVYGNDEWGKIKMTSYYSPLMKGSYKKTKELSRALYLNPKDMVFIDIDAFAESFPKWKTFKEQVLEQKSSKAQVRARVLTEPGGQSKIVPYYTREDIDDKGVIKDKDRVLVYVDPIKAFFLHIQGSGIVELPDGQRFTISYAGQNGHPWVGIGSILLDKIPKEKMSMQAIERYLRTLPAKEMQKILNKDPSYIFFDKVETKPITYLGTEVVDGRTVATDAGLFPKGTLGYLDFEKPVFDSPQSSDPKEWQKTSRFILDQDTGGAIRGPARLDLYAGSGPVAEQFAGVIKNVARLYYFVPKAKYLETIPN